MSEENKPSKKIFIAIAIPGFLSSLSRNQREFLNKHRHVQVIEGHPLDLMDDDFIDDSELLNSILKSDLAHVDFVDSDIRNETVPLDVPIDEEVKSDFQKAIEAFKNFSEESNRIRKEGLKELTEQIKIIQYNHDRQQRITEQFERRENFNGISTRNARLSQRVKGYARHWGGSRAKGNQNAGRAPIRKRDFRTRKES